MKVCNRKISGVQTVSDWLIKLQKLSQLSFRLKFQLKKLSGAFEDKFQISNRTVIPNVYSGQYSPLRYPQKNWLDVILSLPKTLTLFLKIKINDFPTLVALPKKTFHIIPWAFNQNLVSDLPYIISSLVQAFFNVPLRSYSRYPFFLHFRT